MNHGFFFQNNPETKCQFMHWKSPSSPRQKKARQSETKFKAIMTIFFNILITRFADKIMLIAFLNQGCERPSLGFICQLTADVAEFI